MPAEVFVIADGKSAGARLRDLSLDDLREVVAGTPTKSRLLQIVGSELMRRLWLARRSRAVRGRCGVPTVAA